MVAIAAPITSPSLSPNVSPVATRRRIVARCPRCRGRLAYEQDRYGAYLSCIACGCVLEEQAAAAAGEADPAPGIWWREAQA